MILGKKCLAILFLFFSCTNQHNQFEGDSKIFEKYLKVNFARSIPEDSTNFFIVSINGCPSCIHKTLSRIPHIKHGICIVSLAVYDKYMPIENQRIWIDTMGKCDRLKYNNGNIGLIQTFHNKIYNIVNIEPTNIDSIFQEFH